MMSDKSFFLWGGQGRPPRRDNNQMEENERNSHEKSEEKGSSGQGIFMCKNPKVGKNSACGETGNRPVGKRETR